MPHNLWKSGRHKVDHFAGRPEHLSKFSPLTLNSELKWPRRDDLTPPCHCKVIVQTCSLSLCVCVCGQGVVYCCLCHVDPHPLFPPALFGGHGSFSLGDQVNHGGVREAGPGPFSLRAVMPLKNHPAACVCQHIILLLLQINTGWNQPKETTGLITGLVALKRPPL